jgi:peptidyl-prolyl cis-trans isomerase D
MNQKNFENAYKVAYYAKSIEPSSETVNTASTAAVQFSSISRDLKSFEKNAETSKLTPRLADIRPNEYAITGLGNARRLIKWIYENNKGTVSEPESVSDKYVVAVITEVKDKGLMDSKSGKTLIEPILISKKKAKQIIDKIGNSKDLSAIATSFNVQVTKADSISFASPFINGVGNEPKILGASFNTNTKGSVFGPIAGNSGVFVIKSENIFMKSSQNLDYVTKRTQVEQAVKGSITYRASESLKKGADLEDFRIKFY